MLHGMETVEHIASVVGRDVLASRLGVGKTAISNAIKAGKFPARWFRVVKDLTEEHGINCPEDLFAFAKEVETE